MRLFDTLLRRFKSDAPPHISEDTRVEELVRHYPLTPTFLFKRFQVKLTDADFKKPLKQFAEDLGLPPAQILFMEIQLVSRTENIRMLSPKNAQELFLREPRCRILDVREPWEWDMGRLPRAEKLEPALHEELMKSADKQSPILFYCHFGVRSMDAASHFVEQGFTNISVLAGGIEAWSLQIDPSVRRYEGSWC